jgi:hypothetical protein
MKKEYDELTAINKKYIDFIQETCNKEYQDWYAKYITKGL